MILQANKGISIWIANGFGLVTILIFFAFPAMMMGQAAVNDDGSNPDASALLDVKSTNKGFLPPRLTTLQRDAINNPAQGLIIYNYDHKALEMFSGSVWGPLSGGFLCGISNVLDQDGHAYHTTLIGDQCWLTENLNTGTMIDMSANPSDNGTIEKYCLFNQAGNCDEYGGLYKWDEMMAYVNTEGATGICPEGWHVPKASEWQTLVDYLGGAEAAANKLKEAGLDHWGADNGGTNYSGFTALPSGYLYENTYWNNANAGYFYTSTENQENTLQAAVYWITEDNNNPKVMWDPTYKKDDAMPVRCIKND